MLCARAEKSGVPARTLDLMEVRSRMLKKAG
jgi:hypothetical protein